MRRRVALLCATAALWLASASLAHADATPVQLLLVYMPNVSNTDTPRASGIAELVMLEGEVRINATDLPHLDDPHRYVAWVVNSETNQFRRLGAFNSAEGTNSVRYENVLPDAIPNKQWNLLLLTVEDGPTPGKPSSRHSIAAVFPRPDSEPLPGILPNTGGLADGGSGVGSRGADFEANWLTVSGLATLLVGLGFVAGYGARRRPMSLPPTPDSRPRTPR